MNSFILLLTKGYLRCTNAKYLYVIKISLTDYLEVEVVKYTDENALRLGQHTITGAIIVHEKCFENEEVLRYVVAHEYSHKKSWFSSPAFILILVSLLSGLIILFGSLLTLQLTGIIFSLLLILIGSIISWVIEYKAEIGAVKLLGINQVISARKLIGKPLKKPLLWNIIAGLTHPTFSQFLTLYKFFHREKV